MLIPHFRIRTKANKDKAVVIDMGKLATKDDIVKLTKDLKQKKKEENDVRLRLKLAKLSPRQREKLQKILQQREMKK